MDRVTVEIDMEIECFCDGCCEPMTEDRCACGLHCGEACCETATVVAECQG